MYTAGANDPHVAGMAMPVFGPGEAFAGALALTGPITRLTREAAAAAAGALRDAAEGLTRTLGGLPPRLAGPAPCPRASAPVRARPRRRRGLAP